MELSQYKLTKKADSPKRWRWPHESDMKHDNLAREYFLFLKYEKRLTAAMLPESKRILNFSDSNFRKRKGKSDYEPPETNHWPNRARKTPQIRSPSTILDMPDLPTEITHQVIDWSKRGNVATIYQNDVYLWNPEKSEPYLLTSNEDVVGNFVRWNRTGDHLAISLCNRICVWYFPKKKEPKEVATRYCCFCVPVCTIISIEWSKNNDIITGCTTGCISILSLPGLQVQRSMQIEHSNGIIALRLSKDESLLAISSLACTVEFFKWPSLKSHFEIDTLSAPTKALAWHPWKDSLFCLGTDDGILTLWNTVTQRLIAVREIADTHIDCLTWSELTGELVASYWVEYEMNDGEIRQDSRIVVYASLDKIVDAIKWHMGRVPYLVWNHDGTQLATAGTDENLCVWDFIDANTKKRIAKRKKRLSVNPVKNLNAFGTCIR